MGRPSTRAQVLGSALLLSLLGCGGGGGTPGPVVERVEVTPGGFLLPGGEGSVQLTARALAPDGSVVALPARWSSSAPGVVSVSAEGRASAAASLGSAQVVAEVAGVRSAPVLALVAWPAAGAVLVQDQQVVGAPVPLDPPESHGPGWRYQVTLRDLAPPAVGAILMTTGELPVGGRVVATAPAGADQLVTLELVPPHLLFEQLLIDEEIDLSDVPPVAGDGSQGTIRRAADGRWTARAAAPQAAAALGREFKVGPFACELAAEIPGLTIEIPDYGASQHLRFVLRYHTGDPERLRELAVRGGFEAWLQLKVGLAAAVEPKITCEALPWFVPVTFLGPLSLVFTGVIWFGPACELSGKITAAAASLEVTGRVGVEASVGLTCPAAGGDCGPAGDVTASGELSFTPDWGTPGEEARFEISGSAYGLAKPGFASPLLLGAGFDVLEVKAGLKATRDHAPMHVQVTDEAYHSGFVTALFAEAGAAATVEKLQDWVPIKVVEAKVTREAELASFPEGTFTVAPARVDAGGSATFTVSLASRTYLARDAVARVRIYRRQPLAEGGFSLVEVCSVAPTASAQAAFSCQATFPAALQGTHVLHAFVESTDAMVPWPLEVSDDAQVRLQVGSPGVVIADPNLEFQVRLWIPKPTGVITEEDMLRLVELPYAHQKGITSLEGLQYAVNLEMAALNHNQIADLGPLAGLTKLTWLSLTMNQITSAEPLRGLVNLEQLYLDYNQLTDVGALSGLVKLLALDLRSNQITDARPLIGLVGLDWIHLGMNRLTSVEGLGGMTRAVSVAVNDNQVVDLSPLAGLINLKTLDLTSNQVRDISPLVANPGLSVGDAVTLTFNRLDLSPGTRASLDLAALLARGVIVYAGGQTSGP
ncbi:MAG: leucine-rich repeat domain-containing protein [Anaeromyxobacter sp.]|nr:leucine-rich repeat domain-containing protein [Anaeromyxobacter sp.]